MKRVLKSIIAVAALVATANAYTAQAAFFSYPRALRLQLVRIPFGSPTLAPLAYSRFCMQYSDDCEVQHITFRKPHPIALTPALMQDLIEVNREVNRAITPREDEGSVVSERWLVSPESGACHDFAVTKRHELLARGWPSRSLLLAEVVVPWGEHHLVVVVKTDQGDLVLDNLNAGIRPWSRTPYEWVRMQSSSDPNIWMSIAHTPPAAIAHANPSDEDADSSSDGAAFSLRKS